jgi:predicted RNA-binding Zn-ribbon protein involved in translation (DUF1610 family)
LKLDDERSEFECPKCGEHCFSSYEKKGKRIYTCRGDGNGVACCKFQWPPEDSWKYFKLVKYWTFENDAEYQADKGS